MAEKTQVISPEQRTEQLEKVLNEIDRLLQQEETIDLEELHDLSDVLVDMLENVEKSALEDRLVGLVRNCVKGVLKKIPKSQQKQKKYKGKIQKLRAIRQKFNGVEAGIDETAKDETAPTGTQVIKMAALEDLQNMDRTSIESMIASRETLLETMTADDPARKGVEDELEEAKQIYQERFGPKEAGKTKIMPAIPERQEEIKKEMKKNELLQAIFHQTGKERIGSINIIGKEQEEVGLPFKIETTDQLKRIVEGELRDFFKTENIPDNVLDWGEVLSWLTIKLKNSDELQEFSNQLMITLATEAEMKKPEEKVTGIDVYIKEPGKLIIDIKEMTEEELKRVIKEFEAMINQLPPDDHEKKKACQYALQHANEIYEERFGKKPEAAPPPPPPDAGAQPLPPPPEFEAIDGYTKDKPEAQKLFLGAMELLAKKEPEIAELQNALKKSLDYFKKLKPDQLKNEKLMARLFQKLELHTSAIQEALVGKKARDKKTVLLRMNIGKLKTEFTKIYALLEIDPKTIENEEHRKYIEDAQAFFQQFLDQIDHEKIKGMDLVAQKQEAKNIKDKYDDEAKEFMDSLEKEIGPIETKKEPKKSEAPPPTAGTAEAAPSSPEAVAGAPEPSTTTPEVTTSPKADEAPPGEAEKKEAEKKEKEKPPEKAEVTSGQVEALVKKFLINEKTYSKDDPTCRAIETLVMENKLNLKDLEVFLRSPRKELKDSINREAIEGDEGELKAGETYEQLKKRLEDEMTDIAEDLRLLSGHRPTPDEEAKRDKLQARRKKLRGILNDLGILIQIEKDFAEYSSPRHVLGLIAYFIERHKLNKKEEDIKIDHIEGLVTKAVTKAKEAMEGKWGILERIGFVFHPTLKKTLMALKEDEELSQLGENPEAILAKLAKAKTQTDVREWLMELSGKSREKFNEHVYKTVPRLIAYLEIAIREGKSSNVFRTGPFEDLIRLLRGVQHSVIRTDVQKKEPNLRKRMILYLEEMNKINRYTDGISVEILEKNVFRSKGAKWVAGGGLATAAGLGGAALLGATPPGWIALAGLGGASAIAYIASLMKRTPVFESDRPTIRKWAKRSLAASTIGLAGLGMGALAAPVIGGLALPIGAALGLGAILGGKKGIKTIKEKAPEWYKAGKEQTKKGAWAGTKWGAKQGWRGGAWVTKAGLKTAGVILKYGGPWGPFVAFYKAKKYIKERKK